jgi:hypothetical protein
MFFKTLRLRVKREIEELKALHRIELAEKEAAHKRAMDEKEATLTRQLRDKERELQRLEGELRKDSEIKLREVTSLLKLESEQKMKQMELDHQRKVDSIKREASEELTREKQELLKTHYDKLTNAMTKLHEEGNVTTKFTHELALKMLDHAPAAKSETKVLTGSIDVKS